MTTDPAGRVRALVAAAEERRYALIVTRKPDGRWRARAYSLEDYRGDAEEEGETELHAVEAVVRRIGVEPGG